MSYELRLASQAGIIYSFPNQTENLLTSGIGPLPKFEDWQHRIYYSNLNENMSIMLYFRQPLLTGLFQVVSNNNKYMCVVCIPLFIL